MKDEDQQQESSENNNREQKRKEIKVGDLGHGLFPRRRNGAVDLLHAATTNDTRADSVAASIVKIDRTLPYIYLPCNY